ncbi:hypothetical protein Q5752_002763 [Cryptotrichosporon argae]
MVAKPARCKTMTPGKTGMTPAKKSTLSVHRDAPKDPKVLTPKRANVASTPDGPKHKLRRARTHRVSVDADLAAELDAMRQQQAQLEAQVARDMAELRREVVRLHAVCDEKDRLIRGLSDVVHACRPRELHAYWEAKVGRAAWQRAGADTVGRG